MKEHHYDLNTEWTGSNGKGTTGYRDYERSYTIAIENKINLNGSSDPAFRGDKNRHNPEDLLLASLSSCHMLSYLHVCVMHNITVTAYTDHAKGTMSELSGGSGHFTEVLLQPIVTVKELSMIQKAIELHHKAHELCFIANSVNFPVRTVPTVKTEE